MPLEPTYEPFECLGQLSSEARLSAPSHLRSPTQFKNLTLNHFKIKIKLIP